MFTIDDVQMICSPDVFNEGMQLRMSDMNRRLQYFESSGTVSLHGDIFDTHDGQVYHARATVNDRTGFLLNCECGCALFRKTEEPCRHIAAALIMYADARESGRIRIGRGGPRPSDPSVLSLIEQVPPEENRPDTSHTVRIRPIVSLDPRNHAMHAEFRIGREGHKEYVLKSVHALMSALEEKDTIIYGKDLSFIPCDDSFTEDSLPLLHWLYDLDMVSSSYKDDPYWWSYSYRNQDNTHISRDLILKGRYLDEFIDLLDHCLMDCTLQGGRRAQEAGIWFVQEGDSPVMSSIRKDDKGYSFVLSMPDRLEGARWLYFILPETKTLLRRARKTEMNALLKYADQHNGDQVYIAERDIAAFTRKLYPALQKHTVPELSGYDPAVWLPMRPVFEIRLDLPQEETINAELYAVYGQKKYNLLDPLEQQDPHRNSAEEKAYDTDVSSWFNSFDPENHRLVLINDPDGMYRLLKEGIPHFQTLGNVYVSDRLKKIQVRSAPTLHLGVSVSGDILQLDLFTDTMRPEELAEILSRYDMKKKYHRLKNGDFIDLDQDSFRDLARLNEDMAFSTNDLRTGRIRLPKYRAALLDADLKDSSVSYTREQSYRDLLHAFETMQTDPVPVPERWSGILREYQKKG
ncbi:MAG: SNF2 helicase associated domain-containing protein, partial [Solobacterium sp.]|nr:SNF2 helicase associated domain-containing protein [Solobacterium sp.]